MVPAFFARGAKEELLEVTTWLEIQCTMQILVYQFCGLNSIDKLKNPLEALHIDGCLSTIRKGFRCMQIHTHVATSMYICTSTCDVKFSGCG